MQHNVEFRRPGSEELFRKMKQIHPKLDEIEVATITKNAMIAAGTGGALVIYGPQGCGKTRNADLLCKAFGRLAAVDWDGQTRIGDYSSCLIIFTNEPIGRRISFEKAMRTVRSKQAH